MRTYASLLLVTKADHAAAAALGDEMARWLTARGLTARVLCAGQEPDVLRAAAHQMHAVIILGGDGTFIGVARKLVGCGLPFLGINFGRLGFLTEVPAADWQAALERLLADRLHLVHRMALGWAVHRAGQPVCSGHAINDVVVGRGNLARVITVHVRVEAAGDSAPASAGRSGAAAAARTGLGTLGWIRADGLIVASPLGSSAYSLSARGPLVHPDLSNLLVTAIAPFLGSMPPLVLPGECRVELMIDPAAASGEVCLTVDGQEGFALHGDDVITVSGVPGGLPVLLEQADSYAHTLRRRGFVREFVPATRACDTATGQLCAPDAPDAQGENA